MPQPGAAPADWSFGGRRGPLMVLLIGVLVSALVAGGFGVWSVVKDDDSAPAASDPKTPGDGEDTDDPGKDDETGGNSLDNEGEGEPLPAELIEAQVLATHEQPDIREGDHVTDARGMWLVDGHLVRGMVDAIVSTDLATGKEVWSFPLIRGECGVSPQHSQGRIALMQGRDCEEMTVLDITTGEEVWTTPLPTTSTDPDGYDLPVIFGDHVAIAWSAGGFGWRISTEELLWEASDSEQCGVESYAVFEEAVVELRECGDFSLDGMPGEVIGRDADGNELWKWSYDAQVDEQPVEVEAVISADPLIVQTAVGESLDSVTQLWVIDDTYDGVDKVLGFDEDTHVRPCERHEGLATCPGAVVDDGMLYLPSTTTGADNTVVAFDLSSGNPLWEVAPVGDVGGQLLPVRAVDGKILAYQLATYELPGMVIAIDPETETAEPVMVLTADTAEGERNIMSSVGADFGRRAYWQDNRFFLLSHQFYDHRVGEAVTLVFG
jgi:outer membrane protein assembly factor BamB